MTGITTSGAIITGIGSIVTGAVSWIGSFLSVVTSNPIILFATLIPVVGLGIGLLKRLLNTRA